MQEQYAIVRAGVVADVVFAGEAFVTAMVARACFGAPRIQEVGDEIYGPVDDEVAVGWTRDPETGAFAPPVVEVDLGALKRQAEVAINEAAERALNALMPPGRTQLLLATAGQARAVADLTPSEFPPAGFPLVAAAVPRLGANIWDAAEAVLKVWGEWVAAAAAIETARASSQIAIAEAEDPAAVEAALGSLNAALSAA